MTIQPSSAAVDFLQRPHRLLIGGQWREGRSNTVIEVENPARAEIIARVASAGEEDVDAAVAAARQALEGAWGRMPAKRRAEILFRFADLLAANVQRIAEIEVLENGMPLAISTMALQTVCVDLFRYYGGWVTKLEGATIPTGAAGREEEPLLVYTLREPIGVVGAIIPWNSPAAMVALKMAPALASGCALVLKTAELTPLTAELFAELWLEAGGPEGSFNLIHGHGADVGAAMVRHPGIDKISFTGSTAVGKEIVRACADDLKRVSLELGGKSPFIVYPDAPMQEAIPAAAMACFFLSGQNCMAGTRLFVHEAIAQDFVAGVGQFADQVLKVGDGLDPGVMIGPLISERQKARVQGYVETGTGEGAEIAWQGAAPDGPGHFVRPTIFRDVRPEMRIAQEEIFGPVLAVQTFGDDERALARAVNGTKYGLSGSVWTSDLRRAHRMARVVDSGQVGVNIHAAVSPETPFGGNKQSGWGRGFGREGIDGYLKTKAVSVNLGVDQPQREVAF